MSSPSSFGRQLTAASLAILLLPTSAGADDHCDAAASGSGSVSPDGVVEAIAGETTTCRDEVDSGQSSQSFPRYHWTTQDIFWGSEGGCPPGEVDGIRRYWLTPAPGAEPVSAYDAPACVPIPDTPEHVDVDAQDIGAILRGYLPTPTVARDPYVDGLVNLETYFWYDGDPLTDVDHDGDPSSPPRPGWQATIAHHGITISATLHVERFTWQVAPGEHVSATRPGSPDDPAAGYTYHTTGTYDLVASTTWAGSYTWSLGGLTGNGTLGGVTLDSPPDPFRVREVRAVPAQPDP